MPPVAETIRPASAAFWKERECKREAASSLSLSLSYAQLTSRAKSNAVPRRGASLHICIAFAVHFQLIE